MFKISVESEFAAAHRIREYGGDCENLHGHNFKVILTASFAELPPSGMCMDFRVLKKKLNGVLDKLDHQDINRLEYFREVNPTSENIAKYIFDQVKETGVPVYEVTVFESDKYSASYTGD
ncbi:MAG: 6-carboxytetrahydropterin synthase QueD [Elusimicrobia bacterium]|nr:6-carboxytetrahydropterin synthase QueD [Elusimicrobiota bacterium]